MYCAPYASLAREVNRSNCTCPPKVTPWAAHSIQRGPRFFFPDSCRNHFRTSNNAIKYEKIIEATENSAIYCLQQNFQFYKQKKKKFSPIFLLVFVSGKRNEKTVSFLFSFEETCWSVYLGQSLDLHRNCHLAINNFSHDFKTVNFLLVTNLVFTVPKVFFELRHFVTPEFFFRPVACRISVRCHRSVMISHRLQSNRRWKNEKRQTSNSSKKQHKLPLRDPHLTRI